MKATSLEQSYVMNMRRQRAEALSHLTMQKIQEFIHPDDRKHAHYALLNLFMDKGFDVVTDEMRERAGLEPRGELGWTERELHVIENVRILEMLKPASATLPLSGL
jgi:hypothetical protein